MEEPPLNVTDPLPRKPMLTLEAARRVLAAAEAEAARNAWPVVIAVVDDGGHLIALARLDQAQFGSVDVAIAKARAAVAYKRPTKAWDDVLHGGRLACSDCPACCRPKAACRWRWVT